jgi:hypothetical protein
MTGIKKLERIINRNVEWREADRAKKERDDMMNERYRQTQLAPIEKRTDFWCDTCKLDFNAIGTKALCGNGRSRYDAKCPLCNHICSRRITEVAHDPFFQRSESIRKARWLAGDDLVQPDDPRWEETWGKKARLRESYDREGQEKVEWQKRKNRT